MSTKLRPKVPCDCKKCNGKLVDTRTRKKHYEEEKQFQSSMKKGKEKEASSSMHASTSGIVLDLIQLILLILLRIVMTMML